MPNIWMDKDTQGESEAVKLNSIKFQFSLKFSLCLIC